MYHNIKEEEERIKIEEDDEIEKTVITHSRKKENNIRNQSTEETELSFQTQNDQKISLQKKKIANSAKNIVKNFGRAMVTFAISSLAFPYIQKMVKDEKIEYKEFKDFLFLRKENIDGISSLRNLLLVEEYDDNKISSIKRIFQYAAEVFIKYFSVNWIFHSKLGDKIGHVYSRFKILRRIRDPEHFTYLKI
jgi:hypothetical protein